MKFTSKQVEQIVAALEQGDRCIEADGDRLRETASMTGEDLYQQDMARQMIINALVMIRHMAQVGEDARRCPACHGSYTEPLEHAAEVERRIS